MGSNQVTVKQAVAANLKVDPSGVTSPVSIATAPVLVAGSALIGKVGIDQTTPGTTNAVSAVLTTGSAAIGKLAANSGVDIGDVDVTSSALPTGASTAAKQPALGTAGTASADVITVQGIASGVPLFAGLRGINISQTPTVTNGAYAAEDAVGGLLTFANAARTNAGAGIVTGITILCKSPLVAATVPSLELAFFNQTFTAMSDNGTWSPSDADMANFIGSIPVAVWLIATTNVAATRFNVGFKYTLTGTSLFAQLVTHTAVTLTSTSDIIVGLEVVYLD